MKSRIPYSIGIQKGIPILHSLSQGENLSFVEITVLSKNLVNTFLFIIKIPACQILSFPACVSEIIYSKH